MPDLSFEVEQAEAARFAAAPLLVFKLRILQRATPSPRPSSPSGGEGGEGAVVPIHAIALRCQIRIEPARRHYEGKERERLLDLFDTPDRWSQTLRPMLWTHTSAMVGSFTESTVVDLPVPCTFDFNVAATKYFYALEDGEVPLSLLFSGTVFHEVADAGLQVAQIPWEKEATFRLAVRVWKEMMEQYYPNSAWLCLRRDVFDRLDRYKRENRIPTWEQALESLLPADRTEPQAPGKGGGVDLPLAGDRGGAAGGMP
jgi:hypothetical protein